MVPLLLLFELSLILARMFAPREPEIRPDGGPAGPPPTPT
jgi:hypothetical protein